MGRNHDRNGCRGFSLIEFLVATTTLLLILSAVFTVLYQGQSIRARAESRSKIHANVRLAMDRLERDLRMVGFGVPAGVEIGATAVWAPAIFHAAPTEIGFRADVDGGSASITCTPKTSNSDCPRTAILLDSLDYYQSVNCKRPDNEFMNLPVVVVLDRDAWQRATCIGFDTTKGSIDVSPAVPSDTFRAGQSAVVTIEQVYYRYVVGSQPSYGRLERYVRYANTPSADFPPDGAQWAVVADHLTDFSFEYRDAAGNTLVGNPLSADNRALVSSVFMFIEGYDSVGPQQIAQLLQAESQVLVRNAGL